MTTPDVRANTEGPSLARWRVSPAGRYISGLLFATLSIAAVIDTAVAGYPWWQGLQPGLVLMPTWYLFAIRPEIRLYADRAVVRNPLSKHSVPLTEVVAAHPSYLGITIRRRDRWPVIGWAVQQANVSEWSGAPTRAKEVADAINAAHHRLSTEAR